ncbi:hypothetical protein L3Y34_014283 [Caenorhabditis briggsae]|uniref:Uncharacterized protein n=1 Tax=Caenorhabditis briggsae TaxID=6238 RepID=A0AAE9IXB6_CAEBR|nr:hypothetical protein L3Y34_014283 [Caenorhabditis briggsae]
MTDITNVSTSMSYDDRPFASGVITTQTSGSLCLEMEGPPSKESTESEIISNGLDPPMDTTQSTENSLESEIKTRTAIKISPLKIAYEKPKLCSFMHFKTLTHIIALCLIPLILVDTVFIFQYTRFHDDFFREPKHLREFAGPANLMALAFSFCHVALFYWRRESNLRSANATFWVTMLTTGSLTVSGFLLWTARPHYLPRQQLIVPFQYISFFGSIIAWSIAGVAVFYEWQASKYAVVY